MLRQTSDRSEENGGRSSTDGTMPGDVLENTMKLDKFAYIAGDLVTGTVSVRCRNAVELICMHVKLIGEGMTQYFKAKFRSKKLCEIKVPPISVKEHSVESTKAWKIPFSLQLDNSLHSSIDCGKKGKVCYYLTWELQVNVGESTRSSQEIRILANQSLNKISRREMAGSNAEEEEFDAMKLQLYSPADTYLAGEKIQFHAYIENHNKKLLKKVAVLLIQNVLFYKSSSRDEMKGRTRSFLMSAIDKSVQLKQHEDMEWNGEIQIPDPVAPSEDGFHRISYELVLVALIKGKKSSIRAVFDQARYHFDIAQYQDDYFRDFLPHARCDLFIGSHHGNKRSSCMGSNQPPIKALNEIWKSRTKRETKSQRLKVT
ncbi:uncharacterized protein [Watersipora subatra]|uniref:uncharacterized protein n=1 Tax=Watersipora subatra TaxID=2589382 RepID=UPI00355C2B5E